ncbi:MAG: SPOR domain-containing protein [Thermodesulfovibrionales bacterium]|nr:SPOR domain-containing protein [Thermodesulfovibrionales bacterium]
MKHKGEGSLVILNRSVVIGIIVLVTTVSFTFGYFVGRYSSKDSMSRTPVPEQRAEAPSSSETAGQELIGTVSEKEAGGEGPQQSISETASPSTAQQPIASVKAEPQNVQPSFKKGAYYLQVGAFKEERRAKKLSEHFKKEPYDVIIKKEQGLHRVYVGTFMTKKEALLAQTRVRKLYKIDSVIIKK